MLTTAARSLASWPSAQVGVLAVERVGDDEAQHGVTEELEALVVGQATVLVGVRAVRQGTSEQRLVDVLADHLTEVGDQSIDGPLRLAGHPQREVDSRGCSRRDQPWCSVRSATA